MDDRLLRERAEALALVKDFIQEKLDGNIKKLPDFDFREIENSEKYGCPDRTFDCDDSEIIKAIYILLWGGIYPDLYRENIGTGKLYRGDTINTFHTMYGREMKDHTGFYEGLERYCPTDELRQKVRSFHKRVSSIGNFWLLPNISAEKKTLNMHRGTNQWRDFIDRFLIELEKALNGTESKDKRFNALFQKNDFFFRRYSGNFKQMISDCCMEPYLEALQNSAEIYPLNYHWKSPKKRDEYLYAAERFQAAATGLIRLRGELLTGKLQQILSEN